MVSSKKVLSQSKRKISIIIFQRSTNAGDDRNSSQLQFRFREYSFQITPPYSAIVNLSPAE